MNDYVAPLDDVAFVLEHVVDYPSLAKAESFQHADLDTSLGVLAEAGRFMADVLAPLNRVGDTVGARREADGTVVTAPGFRDAYDKYVAAGWGAMAFPPSYGGGGFPWVVNIAVQEMMTSANMGFSLCPLLTQGAIDALLHYGSEEQQETYLAKMVSGQWTGTMNLTEPQAGSDVGALTTRAVAQADGTYRLTGQKIFITYGEQDLSENIVHLVLARTEGAPAGTRGISCFVVPKFLLDSAGDPAARNDVVCLSIEHKLGIHASPTCVLSYGDSGEGAVGYLIGEENAGMRIMFVMMNNARLSVGLQGLAIGERAFQQAVGYARERRQGKAVHATGADSSPIADHADVRRMLMTMKASIEALRCMMYLNAASIDRSTADPDAALRERNGELVGLLTPICKAFGTDLGVELASLNIQIHGGMGFIEETGAAQHWRDSRIAPIYEGTNGIQSADLVARKLGIRSGAAVADVLDRISAEAAALQERGGEFAAMGAALAAHTDTLRATTHWMLSNGSPDPNATLAGSGPYLRMFGLVVGGWLLGQSAAAAQRLLDDGGHRFERAFLEAKVVTARFYLSQILPQVQGLQAAATAGAADLFAIDAANLASHR